MDFLSRFSVTRVSFFVLAFAFLGFDQALAQAPIGARAQGLAGAFVGVADDASAVYWNPSGLATGAFVSVIADYSRLSAGEEGAGERQTTGIVAFTAPPVGLAYYRLNTFGAGEPKAAVSGLPGREEVRRSVHALTTSTVGLALLQSLGDYVVVGGTLKLVRGSVASGTVPGTLSEVLGQAEDLPRHRQTRGDVDLSAMAAIGKVRLGAVVRNVTTPSFALDAAGSEAVELQRQARVGGAWGSGWPGIARLVLAVDADLTRRSTAFGDRRDIAAGAETWWRAQRLGVRAGVRRSTIGDARGVFAGGVSAALKPGTYVEAHVAGGSVNERSWSVGARVAF